MVLGLTCSWTGCIYSSQVDKRTTKVPARYARAEVHGAKKPTERPSAAKPARPPGRWWRLFKDPQLDRLMSRALDDNFDLQIARAKVAQSRASLMAASSGWYPTIQAKGQASRSRSVFNAPPPINARAFEQNNFQMSLQASYEIDLWGKVRYARQAAKYELEATENDLRAAYITVAANVADAYFLVVQQRALLKLLEQTIKNRDDQVKLVRQRYNTGVGRASDLYQALQLLAQAKDQQAKTKGALKKAEHALAVLVGQFPGKIRSGALDELPAAVIEPASGVPASLLMQRPDLRAAHERLLAADAKVGEALADHFPTISLSASVGGRFAPTGLLWNLLGQLLAPLFQGGKIEAERRRRDGLLAQQIASFRKTLTTAVKEVEDALVDGRALVERIEYVKQRVTAAEGALRLSTDQYAQGLSPYLDVLSAEQTLFSAQSDLIAARRDLLSARITLARSLGGSWMNAEIQRNR